MGRFVNTDNSAFKMALNSEIYVDKSDLSSIQTECLILIRHLYVIAVQEDSESQLQQICLWHIIAKAVIQKGYLTDCK